MPREQQLPDLLESALANHQTMRDLVEASRHLTSAEVAGQTLTVREILQIVTNTLVDHIAQEERGIYPALFTTSSNSAVVSCAAEIQEQHLLLLEKARRVNTELLQGDGGCLQLTPHLQGLVRDFTEYLTKHSLAEDVLFRFVRHALLPPKSAFDTAIEAIGGAGPEPV